VDVFFDDEDRHYYKKVLRDQADSRRLLIWNYALMTNHVHFIVVPQLETSLAETFRNAHSNYSQWFNRKYNLKGHLWQARYYSCLLDERHLWSAVRYVERNPVRANIVKRAEDYKWSSAHAHAYGITDWFVDSGSPLIAAVADWAKWLSDDDTPGTLEPIRKATARDLPLADESFVLDLEAKLGRRLRPNKRGRKAKTGQEEASQTKLAFED